MSKFRIAAFILLSLAIILTACMPVTPEPDIPVTGDDIQTHADLLRALNASGAEVQSAGVVDQPFIPFSGQVLSLNGADVQVFEFADQAAREAISNTISATGDQVGPFTPEWLDIPNIWAEGRLIVIYIGQDQNITDLLTDLIGGPIAGPIETEPVVTPVQPTLPTVPDAVREVIITLSASLGIPVEQVQIVNFEYVEWPDACLGISEPGELCAQVITPGYRVVLQVNDQNYEFRTDQTGTQIRQVR